MKFVFLAISLLFITSAYASLQELPGKMLAVPPEKNSVWGVDPLFVKGPDQKKLFFDLTAGYSLKFGNTNTNDVDAGTSLKYNDGRFELLGHVEYHYGDFSGKITENNFSSYINLDYFIIPRLEFFIFSKFEFDSITGIIFRNNTGTGLKFIIFRNWLWLMDLSAAPTFQYEQRSNNANIIDPRLSFRYRIVLHPLKTVQFNFVLFYIPNMMDFIDYRYDADTYIRFMLLESLTGAGSGLFLNIGYKRKFNSMPFPGKAKSDNNFYTALSVNF